MKLSKIKVFRKFLLFLGISLIFWCFWSVRDKMDERPDEIWETFFLSGNFVILVSCFWWAYDLSKKATSGEKLPGSRFQRTIKNGKLNSEVIEAWAKNRKYIKHASSVEKRAVYLKKDYPVYPIFVSLTESTNSQILEAWVSTAKKDLPIVKGFQFLGSLRLGLKDVNILLELIGEEKIK